MRFLKASSSPNDMLLTGCTIASNSQPRTRLDFYPGLLLLIPVIVLLGDRSIIFNFPGYLDSWIYYSFFRNLVALKRLFPFTYYGSRLSWLLPGSIVHAMFPTSSGKLHPASVGLVLRRVVTVRDSKRYSRSQDRALVCGRFRVLSISLEGYRLGLSRRCRYCLLPFEHCTLNTRIPCCASTCPASVCWRFLCWCFLL